MGLIFQGRDGRGIASQVTSYMKYCRYLEDKQRRESWSELVERSRQMHTRRYPSLADDIAVAFKYMEQGKILSSMRAAQFGGRAIETKENRTYNCAYLHMDDLISFRELFYNLLCGTGVGYSVQHRHIKSIPAIQGVTPQQQLFVIPDTIEGWCDAVDHLLRSYMTNSARPVFDYSKIRPEGARLATSGGIAPGPEPLRRALNRIERILRAKPSNMKLTSLEIHDICCHIADAVHAGGIRRAAMISFFDRWDGDMLRCKQGAWWDTNPQRGRANNSAVFVRGQVSRTEFMEFWDVVRENNTGEPGIYWTWDPDILSNPCVEISLHSRQFCNLTTINAMLVNSQKDLETFAIMAARLGTLQAGYTNFDYLSSEWGDVTKAEALLGVSITGIGGGRLKNLNLQRAAAAAVAENRRMAKLMGINPAARVTCIKPEGTGSLVLGTPSGIHSWHSPHYFRCLRIGRAEAVHDYLWEKVPGLMEACEEQPDEKSILRVPIAAGEGYYRTDETALDLLNRVKRFYHGWVEPGHISGANTHNISCTVNIRENEWGTVGEWMWENRGSYNGLATMPFWGGTHRQLPFATCTEAEYQEGLQHLGKIDLTEIVELEDTTKLSGTIACAGGVCEITDL